MTHIDNYSVHDFLSFRIISDSFTKGLSKLNRPFNYFLSDNENRDPDVVVKIGQFKRKNIPAYIVDNKYFIAEDYFYCKDNDGRTKWELEMNGFESDHVEINFRGNSSSVGQLIMPDYLVQNIILRPLLEVLMLRRKRYPIHSLGLIYEGNAILFAARGGAHKTRMSMEIVRTRKADLLGDDWNILDESGTLFSYPFLPEIMRYRASKQQTGEISSPINKIKFLMTRGNQGELSQLYSKKNGKVKSIILASRTIGENDTIISRLEKNEVPTRLISSNQLEMMNEGIGASIPFFRYMQIYSYIFPNSRLANHWIKAKEFLGRTLKDVPSFEMKMQDQYDHSIFEAVLNLK